MKQEEAIRLLVKARATATDRKSARVPPAGSDNAMVAALDRLLLDIRTGRIDEFHLDDGGPHVVITNWLRRLR
ncbi:hypothetical protein [Paraburkholderia tropica]|uniref:hypothetical protein n=1 Tax=Paraburkholderia tropica TaxID=92647 RepID=UPI00359F927B